MEETAKRADDAKDSLMRELCAVAREGGAEDAVVISTKDIITDPRVRFKCMISPCYCCGTCRHCPPYGYSLAEVRAKVAQYEKAIFFRIAADQSSISAPGMARACENLVFDDEGGILKTGTYFIISFQIVALIEQHARQFGYEPVGFAASDCRVTLCFIHPGCRAIKDKTKCRHPDLSRPSMESCGMDAFAMAANMGWDIYPLGSCSRPGDAPRASVLGLVLVY